MRYLLERPEAHYTDNYAVSEEKARLNKTVFRLRLKEVVDRCDLRSVDRVFHTRGAATAKALSPNLRLLRGTIRSPLWAVRSDARDGRSATGVIRSAMYCGACPTRVL